jgi:hypothetical protein
MEESTEASDGALYVRDVTHPNGECPLHGTEGGCPCTDTGLLTERDYKGSESGR